MLVSLFFTKSIDLKTVVGLKLEIVHSPIQVQF